MPRHDHHKQPRCPKCGRPVERLPYTTRDGRDTVVLFEPWSEAHWSDPDAKKYVRYTERTTLLERARLVTPEEPFGTEEWTESDGTTHDEYPLKRHLIVCQADPRSPAYQPDASLRVSPHHVGIGAGP